MRDDRKESTLSSYSCVWSFSFAVIHGAAEGRGIDTKLVRSLDIQNLLLEMGSHRTFYSSPDSVGSDW